MQCQQCKRRKVYTLYSYGGMMLCPECHDKHNPKIRTVNLLSGFEEQRLKDVRVKLKSQLQDIENKLAENERVKASGKDKLDFTSSVYHAFKTTNAENKHFHL